MMNQRMSLCGRWDMKAADDAQWVCATVPGSVYADLLDNRLMEDPYWRANERDAELLMEKDYLYRSTFTLTQEATACDALLLVCEGLDTLAMVTVNGQVVLEADNMHRTWVKDILSAVHEGENEVTVHFSSPTRYERQAYARSRVDGFSGCTQGFPFLRKAHCMSGWDWGPRLPDAGIWRNMELVSVRTGRLLSVRIHQEHEGGGVTLTFHPEIERYGAGTLFVRYTVRTPDGCVIPVQGDSIRIDKPQLWWPNGYGAQPLYSVRAELVDEEGAVLDVWERRIGLRTLTIRRDRDEWGEAFAICANGVSIFAMGADYIPEDNILRRVTPERTRRLLEDAVAAHHNVIRVWGGGYYPGDAFYDACDELGMVVWQDFMFACAMYELTPAFEANIRAEAADNIRRLRHHASLGLWCGNNEMELGVVERWYDPTPSQVSDYVKMYEYILPQVLSEYDPDTFYWPASPSSGGSFDNPNDEHRGDVHYWEVWHGGVPFTECRKYHFRFVSEFGFQSLPAMRTIESFTLPQDRNLFSYVMEKHQRNDSANGKILNYLSQTFLYPANLDTLVYASQLLQAEAIRYGVEHWRRNRGRCMGAIYWQLNDCWPVASWSSIDYYGRWKALHYVSRRFFAPVLLSCEEKGTLTQRQNINAELGEEDVERSIRLNVSNETMQPVHGLVRWALRNPQAEIVEQGEVPVDVPALSACWLEKQVFRDAGLHDHYVSYELLDGETAISSGTALFCAPKHFHFADPHLKVRMDGDLLIVSAEAYARQIELICEDGEVLFEDNYFDLNSGERSIRMLRGKGTKFSVRSVYDIR